MATEPGKITSSNQGALGDASNNPDVRVLEAPRTRLAGTRDSQREYHNLYDRGSPPAGGGKADREERDYNEAFGQGGFPSEFYGRDSDTSSPGDHALVDGQSSGAMPRTLEDSSNGSSDQVYYRAQDMQGYVNNPNEPYGAGVSAPFAASDTDPADEDLVLALDSADEDEEEEEDLDDEDFDEDDDEDLEDDDEDLALDDDDEDLDADEEDDEKALSADDEDGDAEFLTDDDTLDDVSRDRA